MNGQRFFLWCARVFVGLVVIAAAAAIFLKGAPSLPNGVAEAFAGQAEETPAPTATPLPSPTPAPRGAAIVYKGETLAVARDAADANRALSLALESAAQRAAQAAGGEAVDFAFLAPPLVQPAGEDAVILSIEEAALLLGAEGSSLEMRVTVRTYEIERVAFEIKTEKVASLPPGARLVKSYGREGLNKIAFEQMIRGGEQGERTERETEVLRESTPRVILLGRDVSSWNGPAREKLPEGLSLAPPVDARIGANFGGEEGNGRRYGVDYNAAEDAPVHACGAGVVVAVLERAGYGLTVEIDHGGDVISRCAKLKEAGVAVGERVDKGDPIGTSTAKGPRFELWVDGIAVNPRDYIK